MDMRAAVSKQVLSSQMAETERLRKMFKPWTARQKHQQPSGDNRPSGKFKNSFLKTKPHIIQNSCW
jgi:hypothetical protein